MGYPEKPMFLRTSPSSFSAVFFGKNKDNSRYKPGFKRLLGMYGGATISMFKTFNPSFADLVPPQFARDFPILVCEAFC